MSIISAAAGGAKIYVSQKDFITKAYSPIGNGIDAPKFMGQLWINTTENILFYGKEVNGARTWEKITVDNTIYWVDIEGKPTTLDGFGIKDAYTDEEIDDMINALSNKYAPINHTHPIMLDSELDNILNDVFK